MPILQKKKLRLQEGLRAELGLAHPTPHYTCELLSLTSSPDPTYPT